MGFCLTRCYKAKKGVFLKMRLDGYVTSEDEERQGPGSEVR